MEDTGISDDNKSQRAAQNLKIFAELKTQSRLGFYDISGQVSYFSVPDLLLP